ncbi:protein shisa-5 isoform X2 [Zootermopsis nevadensis]|uniref:protein shisa-5 isoform X2 n=1 Tax=Zootermopsis nevadensis TaxID=136037 RepID=UPI000B8E91DB|nr:protein shisa-5 isoform X2 [Zootermopsis nevadensis]
MGYCWLSALFVSYISLSWLHVATCMECALDHHQTLLERLDIVKVKSCPSFFDNADNMYCCVDANSVYCCNSTQFFFNSFAGLLPILIAAAVGFLLVFCLCCLCCPCCLIYKRRHRGTVYGRVQTTVATPQPVQQQAPLYPPQPTLMPMPQTTAYPVYPPLAGQQPPPYSEATANEVYSKQAPYNPNFQ